MNNKGFTLVELLATIVILGLVMGIATYGVISAIDSSKKKSEEVFVSKFTSAIDSYLALNGDKLGEKSGGGSSSSEQKFVELNSFKLSDLDRESFIDKDKFINPRNKDENCYNGNAVIRAFRDDQFVYYYYFDFKQLGKCLVDIDDENNELVKEYESNSNEVASYAKSNNTNLDEDEFLEAAVVDEVYESLSPGDYVLYTPPVTNYPTVTSQTGYSSSQMIYPSELNLWRVLSINDNGTIDVISEYVSSTDVYFKGLIGYQNLIRYLNELASKYRSSTYTVGSRYFGYGGQTERISVTKYLLKQTPPWPCKTGEDCSPDPDDYEPYGGGDNLYMSDYDLLYSVLKTGKAYKVDNKRLSNYWVATRYYLYNDTAPAVYGRFMRRDDYGLTSSILYSLNDSSDWSVKAALRPIVVLKANLTCYSGDGKTKNNPCSIMR